MLLSLAPVCDSRHHLPKIAVVVLIKGGGLFSGITGLLTLFSHQNFSQVNIPYGALHVIPNGRPVPKIVVKISPANSGADCFIRRRR
jgi:hypothetical protein